MLRTLAALPFLVTLASAQVTITSTGEPYRQNFDRSDGWRAGSLQWTDNTLFPGWHAANYNSDSGDFITPNRVLVGSGEGGPVSTLRLYRSATQPADGALGSQAHDDHVPAANAGGVFLGLHLINGTGKPVTRVTVSYRVELWRLSTTGRQATLSAAFLVGGERLTDEDEWTLIPGASFTTPRTEPPGGPKEATNVDGNTPAYVTVFKDVALPSLTLAPGQSLWIRWFDVNNRGVDHGIALDDVEVRFSAD